jgi:hypothetical protein
MDDRQILLHLVATNINLPPGLKQNARNHFRKRDIKRYKAEFAVRKEKLVKKPFSVTQLQDGGMYNATVDTGAPINIKALLATVQRIGLIHDEHITVTECRFKYGRFQTAVTFSGQYAMSGNASKPLNSANFKAKDQNGRGISFDFHKSGKVRFSGAMDPEEVRRFFARYHPIPGEIKVNNRVISFRIRGWRPILPLIHGAFSDAGGKFEGLDVKSRFMTKSVKSKTVGLPASFLYIKFGDEFDAIMTAAGTVQVQGTKNYNEAYSRLRRFLLRLRDNGFMNEGATKERVEKPRPVVSANAPAPDVTRRGTTCPVDRRPNPYGFTGKCKANCYVKPNPQGQPCCYSIPQRIAYSQDKVKAAYNKAGIEIPEDVRRVFNITTRYHAKEVSTKAPVLKIVGNKIDSRQCTRYTKVALVDIARRLRIPLPKTVTKPILCALIKDHGKLSADLLANIRKGVRLRNTRRQVAAEKVQRIFRYYKSRPRRKARAAAPALPAPAPKKATGPALLKPSRKKKAVVAPAKPVSPVTAKTNKKKLFANRQNVIYKNLNRLLAQGANTGYLNAYTQNKYPEYGNQMIVSRWLNAHGLGGGG